MQIISTTNLVKLYKIPVISILARRMIYLLGVDIPRSVSIGKNVRFQHNAIGTVIHENTVIMDDVEIFQGVTIGRADVYIKKKEDDYRFIIKPGACICAGAKVLGKEGTLVIGENSVIGANAVLLSSTGPGEIWGGIPARLIGYRDDTGTGQQ